MSRESSAIRITHAGELKLAASTVAQYLLPEWLPEMQAALHADSER